MELLKITISGKEYHSLVARAERAEAELSKLRALLEPAVEDYRLALDIALSMLAPFEPGDSRAVSNEFVAMACLQAGKFDDECREILLAYAAKAQSKETSDDNINLS